MTGAGAAVAQKRRRGTIALRMIVMLLTVVTIPVMLIVAVMTAAFQDANARELLRSQQYSMKQIVANFENYFIQIDQATQDVIFAEATQQTLAGTLVTQMMRFQVDSIIHKKGYQEGACLIYVDNRDRVYKTDNVHRLGSRLVEALPDSALYQKMNADYAKLRWSLEPSDLFDSSLNESLRYSLFAGRRVRHLDMAVAPGYLMLEIPQNKLRGLMSDPLMYSGTRYLLLAGDSRVVLDSGGELTPGDALSDDLYRTAIADNVSADVDTFQYARRQYVIGRLSVPELSLISILPTDDYGEIKNELGELLFKVALIGAMFAVLLAVAFSRYFTKPLVEMVHAMRKMRGGDLSVQVKSSHRGELGELSETFNIMVNDMRSLIDQIQADQRALKNAEINALIHQINPHFLYNTLDNINVLARRHPDGRISLFITELSNLLRITLSGGREVISLADELSHAESYLKIMRLRGGNAFEYAMNVDGDAKSARMIKLILQPIVENAISHGLPFSDECGRIEISALVTDGEIELSVSDNGGGMSEPEIEALMEKLRAADNPQPSGNRGVGLSNIYRRMRLHYGDEKVRLWFERSDMGGLRVRVRVPRDPGKDGDFLI